MIGLATKDINSNYTLYENLHQLDVIASEAKQSHSSNNVITRHTVPWQSCGSEDGTLRNQLIALYLDFIMIENLKSEVE